MEDDITTVLLSDDYTNDVIEDEHINKHKSYKRL